MAKRYNIVVPRKYTSNGEEKTQWNTVGTLVKFDERTGNDGQTMPEGFIIEMAMFPNTTFKVFEQKPKEEGQYRQPQAPRKVESKIEYPEEEINPDDIPF